ncbi:hypothetical protein C8Q79DRAFT_1041602 [Trametes meyenii]|nr:hypothetical protein C8Q79DRAFT_1041602 [Trametes meyenii]
MKSLSTSIVSAALLVAAVSAQDFQINTPNPPTQCVPVQLSWTGGQAPFFLALIAVCSIKPGGQPSASALQQYSGLTTNSFTWSTNITAGTSIGFTLTDSAGNQAQSAAVTIQSGPDSSCLNGAATSAASGTDSATSAASSATSPAGSTTAAGSTTGATSATSAASHSSAGSTSHGSSTGTSASASASATGGNNGAFSNVASVGIVGVLSAVAAVLLA